MKSINELMNLQGRVALITGGAGFLGAAMGMALAEVGSTIVILDIQQAQGEELAAHLTATYGVKAQMVALDLNDTPALQRLPQQVERDFGRLDVLINCAALVGTSQLEGWAVPFEQQSIDTWRLALEINLTAVFALTQACAPLLRASGHGSVINVASIYGILGPRMNLYEGTQLGNPAAYAASKGGLIQLTRWLSATLAPQVRVNAISAGGIWRNQAETFVERYTAHTPLGRMATEEDFKGAAVYLASDLSRYVTGQNLVVDGGWSAW